MRKRGRPEAKKVPFNETRLWEILKAKNISLRKLNKDESCEVSERTIRRACKNGEITLEALDGLCNYFDVNPTFLIGY